MAYNRFNRTQATEVFVEDQLAKLVKVEAKMNELLNHNSSLCGSQGISTADEINRLNLLANGIKLSLGADESQLEPHIYTKWEEESHSW